MESVKTDSIYINKLQVDSIYMQDSVYIREKGDTIYMYKFKYLDRYKLLTDTMYVWRTSGKQGGTGGYSYWSSGMTAMLDPATGGPLTYDAFLRYIEDMAIRCSKCNREFDEPISYCPDCGSMITVSED